MLKDSINLYQAYDILGKKCKLCNSILHLTEKCNFINYKPYKHKIISNYLKSMQCSSIISNRKRFPRRVAKGKYLVLDEKNFLNESLSTINFINKENYSTYQSEHVFPDKWADNLHNHAEHGLDKLNQSSICLDEHEKKLILEVKTTKSNDSNDHHETESHMKKDEVSRKTKKEKAGYENNLFDFRFDSFKNFQNYFPQYNFNRVFAKQKIIDVNNHQDMAPKINFDSNSKSQRRGTKKILFKADVVSLNSNKLFMAK